MFGVLLIIFRSMWILFVVCVVTTSSLSAEVMNRTGLSNPYYGMPEEFAARLRTVFDTTDFGRFSIAINSGYRSQDDQDQLRDNYINGNSRGSVVMPAKTSSHMFGAADITFREFVGRQWQLVTDFEKLANLELKLSESLARHSLEKTLLFDPVHIEPALESDLRHELYTKSGYTRSTIPLKDQLNILYFLQDKQNGINMSKMELTFRPDVGFFYRNANTYSPDMLRVEAARYISMFYIYGDRQKNTFDAKIIKLKEEFLTQYKKDVLSYREPAARNHSSQRLDRTYTGDCHKFGNCAMPF